MMLTAQFDQTAKEAQIVPGRWEADNSRRLPQDHSGPIARPGARWRHSSSSGGLVPSATAGLRAGRRRRQRGRTESVRLRVLSYQFGQAFLPPEGSPKTTRTGGGNRRKPPQGRALNALRFRPGRPAPSRRISEMNPGLNSPTWPSSVQVPSGKRPTMKPCSMRFRALRIDAVLAAHHG